MSLRGGPAAVFLPLVIVFLLVTNATKEIPMGPRAVFPGPLFKKPARLKASFRIIVDSPLKVSPEHTHFSGGSVVRDKQNKCILVDPFSF